MPRSIRLQMLAIGLGSLPAVMLLLRGLGDRLGANPIEELTHETGAWALRWLLASLAITPLRQELGLRSIAPLRRTLGLIAFTYASLHFAVYAVLDQGLALEFVLEDVRERPYVTVGFLSFGCLVPLAITSTRAWIRRLGRRWTALHRLVYIAAIGAVTHFVWLVKADLLEPLIYAALLTLLLGARALHAVRKRLRVRTASA